MASRLNQGRTLRGGLVTVIRQRSHRARQWGGALLALSLLIASGVEAGQGTATNVAQIAGTTARDSAEQTARLTVENFHATLLNMMQEAELLGYEGRYKWLEPAIHESFALEFMARVVAGSKWRQLSESDQERLSKAFARMTVATYASRFSGFSGETFKTLGVEDAPRGTKLVKTHLVKSDGSTVSLNYVMRGDGNWQVVDIYLDGRISELATRRSEYSSVLRNHGIEELLRRIDARIADLASDEAS